MLTNFFSVVFFLSALQLNAQSQTEFSALIGKSETGEEFSGFIKNYQLEKTNTGHYASKSGVELITKNGFVNEIHLYQTSFVYGNFTGSLPEKLKFGMSSSEVKALLGKPTTAYTSSGYNEYVYTTYVLSCWFENGLLNQIVVSVKDSN